MLVLCNFFNVFVIYIKYIKIINFKNIMYFILNEVFIQYIRSNWVFINIAPGLYINEVNLLFKKGQKSSLSAEKGD